MGDDGFELVQGSGNVFRDFNLPNPDLERLRSILAAQIIKALDARSLTVRKAEEITGIAAAGFSRIRRAKLDRFTVDRLMTVLGRLDQEVDVRIDVRPRSGTPASAEEYRRLKWARTTGETLIAAMQRSPHRDLEIEPQRQPMPSRDGDL